MAPPSTAVAVPITVDGRVRGVLGVWIPLTVWQDMVLHSAPPKSGFFSIFDRDKRLIARSATPERFVGGLIPAQSIARMQQRSSGVLRTVLLEGDAALAAWQIVPLAGWGVGVGVPATGIDAALHQALATTAAITLVFVLLGLAGAMGVARRVTTPLQQLAAEPRARPEGPIVVREIAVLRERLLQSLQEEQIATERLRNKAREFEALFRDSPLGMAFAQDPECRVILRNAALDRLLGRTDDGPPVATVWADGRRLPDAEQPLQRAAAHGETTSGRELEFRFEGRSSSFVSAHALPLLGPDGRPRGAVSTLVDITEARRSEAQLTRFDQRLRESQRLMDLAQEAGHVGFFQYRFAEDALTWTPGQALLFGLSAVERETRLEDWERRLDASDRARIEQAMRAALSAREENASIDFRVSIAPGEWRWLSCRVLLSYDQNGMPLQMIGVTVDVSDQKRVERERAALVAQEQAARLQAEAAGRAKDEFLAMLAHELRNPLSAISSAVQVLDRVSLETEIAGEARRIIGRQTRLLAHLMGDLLDVSRLIAGKIVLSRAPVDLAALAQRVVETARVTGASAQHRLEVDAEPAWVDADVNRIEQVMNNLVSNALKFTPAGGSVRLQVRRAGTDAFIEVSDTGVGIPAALLPRVFDPFVQGERGIDRVSGGLGIGLTLVKRLVEMHGGTVEVQSRSGETRFVIRLPAREAPADAALDEPPRLPAGLRRRLMLIEDNADALDAMRTILAMDGHQITVARDGVAGLQGLLDEQPDVAVIDIGLPGLSGLDLARRSREFGYTGRLIALSGYGQQADIERARRAGFDAHLVKPADLDALRALLNARD